MTEPTDAELLALIERHLGLKPRRDDTVIDPRTGRFHDVQRYRDMSADILAKWGTPPAVAGDPVAWRYRPSSVWDYYVLTDDPGKAARARAIGLHVEALCLTTPQPTQAQAGVVPLTDEQIQDLLLCGNPTDEEMRLIRIGWDAANGIKGGQHGTE